MHRAIEWTEAFAKVLFDGVQLPVYRGFESRRASKDVSPVDRFVLRDAKTVREGPLSCARTFFQKAAIIRARMGKPRFSVGAMQKRPCLRADTVFSGSAPKDSFPRRDGNTQALSRRFCRNDGEVGDDSSGGE